MKTLLMMVVGLVLGVRPRHPGGEQLRRRERDAADVGRRRKHRPDAPLDPGPGTDG